MNVEIIMILLNFIGFFVEIIVNNFQESNAIILIIFFAVMIVF